MIIIAPDLELGANITLIRAHNHSFQEFIWLAADY
jgi:hypothetical protein